MTRTLVAILSLCFLLISIDALATHNRAGEITYTHVEGFTYEVTILTCTDISSTSNADREYMPIDWGHIIGPGNNTQDSIQRSSETVLIPMSIKENYYTTLHTFPGPGVYEMYTEDPNRNAGVNNIPGSVDQIFSITSVLYIYSFSGNQANNSVQLLNPPKEDGCVNQIWSHGVEALDADGDSLAFELIACTGGNGLVVNGYTFPDEWPSEPENGVMVFDQQFGIVTWDSPTFSGLYNIAIRISEYRNGFIMGSVVRDMQIDIVNCPNQPPVNDPLPDVCVVAGEDLVIQVGASDPDGNVLDLTVTGEPFELSDAAYTDFNTNPATGTIQWTPDCDEVRLDPYLVYVRSVDIDNSPELSDNDGFTITVIGPEVEGLNTQVLAGGFVELSWNTYVCEEVSGFKIYRRVGSQSYTPGDCETGLPASAGYDLIETVQGADVSSYTDTDAPFGSEICYRIVACFPDGSESMVSDEVCDQIDLVIPVITHVSVGVTDALNGIDTLRWEPPTGIDTLAVFTGPYSYDILRGDGVNAPELVFTTAETSILDIGSSTFIDNGLDTESTRYVYRVVLKNDGVPVSESNLATSPFLTLSPGDSQVSLSWSYSVPWTVDSARVDMQAPGQSDFTTIAMVEDDSYVAEGLINNEEYCFRIVTFGGYEDPDFEGPFANFSQSTCTEPFDNTPPCPPVLSLNGECEQGTYNLSWLIDLDDCAADAAGYIIYYAPTEADELQPYMEINDLNEQLIDEFESGLVGCFAVSAFDSLSVRPDGAMANNESELSNIICVESCPEYELPNIITPNGDGFNELFEPFMPYSYVDSVDLKIFNRWGMLMFETTDPDVNWTGVNTASGLKVSDGVYYYTVTIYERRLAGLIPRKQAGSIQVLDNRGGNSE